jgi:hypothetical protein
VCCGAGCHSQVCSWRQHKTMSCVSGNMHVDLQGSLNACTWVVGHSCLGKAVACALDLILTHILSNRPCCCVCWCCIAQVVLLLLALLALLALAHRADAQAAAVTAGTTPRMLLRGLKSLSATLPPGRCFTSAQCGGCRCSGGWCSVSMAGCGGGGVTGAGDSGKRLKN